MTTEGIGTSLRASERVEDLLAAMTVAELVALTAGHDTWHTAPVDRLGVPSVRVSDGPVGVRGTRFDGPASLATPCGTALAATWDPESVAEIGAVLGREAHAKGVSVHLAPTVNLHRTPIGGRNFECFSEDPHLTARVAVAYVRGVQGEGVASCIKHFVCNDVESERMSVDVCIDERTLHEVYLVPFEAAVRESGVMAVMTAYNRLNGPWCADSPLIAEVLRTSWGFDGLVMSDWFGLHSTVGAVLAGLDLEMPGPALQRGDRLVAALEAGEVTVEQVRARAREVLRLAERVGALDGGGPGQEGTRHDAADEAVVRRVAAESMVLVHHRDATLPLAPSGLRRLAVIGPNARVGQVIGGGSATVNPTRVSHPLDALRQRLDAHGVEVVHATGCRIHRRLPDVDLRLCGEIDLDIYDSPEMLDLLGASPAPEPLRSRQARRLGAMWTLDPTRQGRADLSFGARFTTVFTPDTSGEWTFGVESVGATRVLVDGVVVIDNASSPVGGSFFGTGREEARGAVTLDAGRSYSLAVEVRQHARGYGMSAVRVGALEPLDDDPLGEAVDLAATCDLTVLVVGTNNDWESEGWDRDSLSLPGDQDELIRRVAEVSRATVVVVNAGSPVVMPWLDDVEAVLMAWFPGQAFGDALVDVLTGAVEPQGRLPMTVPRRLEDTPAFEHHPPRGGVAHYLEGRLVGHRWYDTIGREPLFPFGHGLGYGSAALELVHATADCVTVQLTNTGDREAVEVVQVYAHVVDRAGLHRDEPEQVLAGFGKARVGPGQTRRLDVDVSPTCWRRWDDVAHGWRAITGPVELRVGRSSRDIVGRTIVTR